MRAPCGGRGARRAGALTVPERRWTLEYTEGLGGPRAAAAAAAAAACVRKACVLVARTLMAALRRWPRVGGAGRGGAADGAAATWKACLRGSGVGVEAREVEGDVCAEANAGEAAGEAASSSEGSNSNGLRARLMALCEASAEAVSGWDDEEYSARGAISGTVAFAVLSALENELVS